MKIKDLTQIAIMLSLLIISTLFIPGIPLGIIPVPITLQLLIVFIISFILSPKNSFFTLSLYLLIGCLGFPVFANGGSGIDFLFRTTGGFLLAFPFAALLISFNIQRKKEVHFYDYIIWGFIGLLFIHSIGVLWWQYILKAPLIGILLNDIIFLVVDVLKIFLAALIAFNLQKHPYLSK